MYFTRFKVQKKKKLQGVLITHISIIMNRGILNHWPINSNIRK